MLKRLLAACALLATPLFAQTTPSPNLARIAHVALRVHDLDASVAFYEKLGFVKAFELSKDGKVYEAFIKINDHQFIELYPVDAKNTQVGFLHVCFEGSDLQAVHDYYVAQGLHPIDVRKAGAGNLLFTMPGPMTPQGPQNMEYTQYMPGSLHSKDFGQHLGRYGARARLVSVSLAVDDVDAAKAFYVTKAGFKPLGEAAVAMPGNPNDSIRLVPSFELGQKMRIKVLTSPSTTDQATASNQLTSDVPVVVDPDGNQISIGLKGPLAAPAK